MGSQICHCQLWLQSLQLILGDLACDRCTAHIFVWWTQSKLQKHYLLYLKVLFIIQWYNLSINPELKLKMNLKN